MRLHCIVSSVPLLDHAQCTLCHTRACSPHSPMHVQHSPRVVEARQKRQMSADHCSVHVHASASTETPAWGIGKVSAYFRGLFVQAS